MRLFANILLCCGYAVLAVAAGLYLVGRPDWSGKCTFVGFLFCFFGIGLGFRLKEVDDIRKTPGEPYFPERKISDRPATVT